MKVGSEGFGVKVGSEGFGVKVGSEGVGSVGVVNPFANPAKVRCVKV